jgi:hypothetical protein
LHNNGDFYASHSFQSALFEAKTSYPDNDIHSRLWFEMKKPHDFGRSPD